jgi:single-strand DNA-binding protein
MAELSVFGVGVATVDPELRTVGQKQTSVCNVTLAFNRNYQDANREWQQEASFVRVQVWGNRANRMAELVKKGQPIYVCGYLKQDSWEKDGQKRVAFTLVARDFQLCEKNGKKQSEPAVATAGATSAPQTSDPVEMDDDIPF